MVEFLYAGNIITEELKNLKSNQDIRRQNLVRVVLFYPLKYDQRPTFYFVVYMGEFWYPGKSSNKELKKFRI